VEDGALAIDVLVFVRASLPEPPARVLEVGAGGGELAAALRDLGHQVTAIDPKGGAAGVEPVALLDLPAPAEPFDAAVAVTSLHHVEPLDRSVAHLAELVRPGGTLVIDEFDLDRVDERAARWQQAQREAAGHPREREAAEILAELRHHLHPVATLQRELEPYFELGQRVRGAYLYRWSLPPGLRRVEERLIALGQLPATGARLVGTRRG
jgi:2-polyprenyl-3-methyl-5-hydroxy-6-metoxy-1,4-benzoquinol methylase